MADALGVKLKPYYVASHTLAAMSRYDLIGCLIGDKANSVVFDNSKIKSLVPGFRTAISAEEGIRMTVKNILAHPELQNEDKEFDSWCDDVIERLEKAKMDIS